MCIRDSPNTSFDCSGLTQWCYGKAGISLPRTAQAQYDATQHIPLSQAQALSLIHILLAIIQIESGGTATDVMQSSESLGLPPNSLSTEESIKQGCKYFASLLSSCKAKGMNDINAAIQSYNSGGGYAAVSYTHLTTRPKPLYP